MNIPDILLASNSPRRRQMLRWMGLVFEVRPVDIDETPQPGELPEPYVVRLAKSKAEAALNFSRDDVIVLAADTIVADGVELLGKPDGPEAARTMLRRLRNREHQVCTAIALISPDRKTVLTDLCVSQVPMRLYTDEEIEAYIASRDPLDKAGSYAIQHPEFRPVINFLGCFASVMGLPLCHLSRSLTKMGYDLQMGIAPICAAQLDYLCPITAQVLKGENIG